MVTHKNFYQLTISFITWPSEIKIEKRPFSDFNKLAIYLLKLPWRLRWPTSRRKKKNLQFILKCTLKSTTYNYAISISHKQLLLILLHHIQLLKCECWGTKAIIFIIFLYSHFFATLRLSKALERNKRKRNKQLNSNLNKLLMIEWK